MPHSTDATSEPVQPPDGVKAGPPTKILIGGITSPQTVRIGNALQLSVASMLVDKDGQIVSGATAEWTATANPVPASGITVQRVDQMNGRVSVTNVQRSHTVTLKVTTTQYPQFTDTKTFTLSAI
jgi:hypothetical protein